MESIQLRSVLVSKKPVPVGLLRRGSEVFRRIQVTFGSPVFLVSFALFFHTVDVLPSVSSFKQAAFVYATHLLSWPGKWENVP